MEIRGSPFLHDSSKISALEMEGQVNKIFRKSNEKNAKGFIGSIKFFINDDNSEVNSCNTAHPVMKV